MIKAHINL